MKPLFALIGAVLAISIGIAAQSGSSSAQVTVTLTSDFQTWVSIANVRAPEKFDTASFSLGPGDYNVVGRRKGYVDVQKSLKVQAGMSPIELRIVCTVRVDQ